MASAFERRSMWDERRTPSSPKLAATISLPPLLEAASPLPAGLDIPSSAGRVMESYWPALPASPDFPLVVLVQDAHGHAGAQASLADIVRATAAGRPDQTKPLLVAVEGAWGEVETGWLKSYPDKELRDRLTGVLLAAGVVTGEEAVALADDAGSLSLHGVDDPVLHGRNEAARRDSAPEREKALLEIEGLSRRAALLKTSLYSRDMRDWEQAEAGHAANSITLLEYLFEAKRLAGPVFHSGRFPQAEAFLRSSAMEGTLDRAGVEADVKKIFETVETRAPDDALALLAREALAVRHGRSSPAAFYLKLERLAGETGVSAPHLGRYARYAHIQEGLRVEDLALETAALGREVPRLLCHGNAKAGNLWEAEHRLGGLRRLFSLKLTTPEWEAVSTEPSEALREAETLLSQLEGRDFKPARTPTHLKAWRAARGFYEAACARNVPMAANALAEARRRGVDRLVLVAGGFHAPGLTELLRRSGVSYVVVMPQFKLEGHGALRQTSYFIDAPEVPASVFPPAPSWAEGLTARQKAAVKASSWPVTFTRQGKTFRWGYVSSRGRRMPLMMTLDGKGVPTTLDAGEEAVIARLSKGVIDDAALRPDETEALLSRARAIWPGFAEENEPILRAYLGAEDAPSAAAQRKTGSSWGALQALFLRPWLAGMDIFRNAPSARDFARFLNESPWAVAAFATTVMTGVWLAAPLSWPWWAHLAVTVIVSSRAFLPAGQNGMTLAILPLFKAPPDQDASTQAVDLLTTAAMLAEKDPKVTKVHLESLVGKAERILLRAMARGDLAGIPAFEAIAGDQISERLFAAQDGPTPLSRLLEYTDGRLVGRLLAAAWMRDFNQEVAAMDAVRAKLSAVAARGDAQGRGPKDAWADIKELRSILTDEMQAWEAKNVSKYKSTLGREEYRAASDFQEYLSNMVMQFQDLEAKWGKGTVPSDALKTVKDLAVEQVFRIERNIRAFTAPETLVQDAQAQAALAAARIAPRLFRRRLFVDNVIDGLGPLKSSRDHKKAAMLAAFDASRHLATDILRTRMKIRQQKDETSLRVPFQAVDDLTARLHASAGAPLSDRNKAAITRLLNESSSYRAYNLVVPDHTAKEGLKREMAEQAAASGWKLLEIDFRNIPLNPDRAKNEWSVCFNLAKDLGETALFIDLDTVLQRYPNETMQLLNEMFSHAKVVGNPVPLVVAATPAAIWRINYLQRRGKNKFFDTLFKNLHLDKDEDLFPSLRERAQQILRDADVFIPEKSMEPVLRKLLRDLASRRLPGDQDVFDWAVRVLQKTSADVIVAVLRGERSSLEVTTTDLERSLGSLVPALDLPSLSEKARAFLDRNPAGMDPVVRERAVKFLRNLEEREQSDDRQGLSKEDEKEVIWLENMLSAYDKKPIPLPEDLKGLISATPEEFDTKAVEIINRIIGNASLALNKSHYGLWRPKKLVLKALRTYLNKMVKAIKDGKADGTDAFPPGIRQLLLGPAGVGKTTLGAALAAALGIPFIFDSVAGLKDDQVIKGFVYTVDKSGPGKYVEAAQKSPYPIFLWFLDEVDKAGEDMDKSGNKVQAAIYDVLRGSPNNVYLGGVYDMKKVHIIMTGNFADRIVVEGLKKTPVEVVDIPGYLADDKAQMAPFILRKVRETLDLPEDVLSYPDADEQMARQAAYAPEAGLRQLTKMTFRRVERVLHDMIETGAPTGAVLLENLVREEGSPPPTPTVGTEREIGRTTLFWRTQDGDAKLFQAHAVIHPGEGDLKFPVIRDFPGKRMADSARTAAGIAVRKALQYGADAGALSGRLIFGMPEGGATSDGSHLGTALASSAVSQLRGALVASNAAVLAEITGTETLSPISDLTAHLMAAQPSGVRTVYIAPDIRKTGEDPKRFLENVFAEASLRGIVEHDGGAHLMFQYESILTEEREGNPAEAARVSRWNGFVDWVRSNTALSEGIRVTERPEGGVGSSRDLTLSGSPAGMRGWIRALSSLSDALSAGLTKTEKGILFKLPYHIATDKTEDWAARDAEWLTLLSKLSLPAGIRAEELGDGILLLGDPQDLRSWQRNLAQLVRAPTYVLVEHLDEITDRIHGHPRAALIGQTVQEAGEIVAPDWENAPPSPASEQEKSMTFEKALRQHRLKGVRTLVLPNSLLPRLASLLAKIPLMRGVIDVHAPSARRLLVPVQISKQEYGYHPPLREVQRWSQFVDALTPGTVRVSPSPDGEWKPDPAGRWILVQGKAKVEAALGRMPYITESMSYLVTDRIDDIPAAEAAALRLPGGVDSGHHPVAARADMQRTLAMKPSPPTLPDPPSGTDFDIPPPADEDDLFEAADSQKGALPDSGREPARDGASPSSRPPSVSPDRLLNTRVLKSVMEQFHWDIDIRSWLQRWESPDDKLPSNKHPVDAINYLTMKQIAIFPPLLRGVTAQNLSSPESHRRMKAAEELMAHLWNKSALQAGHLFLLMHTHEGWKNERDIISLSFDPRLLGALYAAAIEARRDYSIIQLQESLARHVVQLQAFHDKLLSVERLDETDEEWQATASAFFKAGAAFRLRIFDNRWQGFNDKQPYRAQISKAIEPILEKPSVKEKERSRFRDALTEAKEFFELMPEEDELFESGKETTLMYMRELLEGMESDYIRIKSIIDYYINPGGAQKQDTKTMEGLIEADIQASAESMMANIFSALYANGDYGSKMRVIKNSTRRADQLMKAGQGLPVPVFHDLSIGAHIPSVKPTLRAMLEPNLLEARSALMPGAVSRGYAITAQSANLYKLIPQAFAEMMVEHADTPPWKYVSINVMRGLSGSDLTEAFSQVTDTVTRSAAAGRVAVFLDIAEFKEKFGRLALPYMQMLLTAWPDDRTPLFVIGLPGSYQYFQKLKSFQKKFPVSAVTIENSVDLLNAEIEAMNYRNLSLSDGARAFIARHAEDTSLILSALEKASGRARESAERLRAEGRGSQVSGEVTEEGLREGLQEAQESKDIATVDYDSILRRIKALPLLARSRAVELFARLQDSPGRETSVLSSLEDIFRHPFDRHFPDLGDPAEEDVNKSAQEAQSRFMQAMSAFHFRDTKLLETFSLMVDVRIHAEKVLRLAQKRIDDVLRRKSSAKSDAAAKTLEAELRQETQRRDAVRERLLKSTTYPVLVGPRLQTEQAAKSFCTAYLQTAGMSAEAAGKRIVEIDLANRNDPAEALRGHSDTYLGSTPSILFQQIAQAQAEDAFVILKNVDQAGDAIIDALLALLDPEQNAKFTDEKVKIPLNFSKLRIFLTAESVSGLPGPLLSRVDPVQLSALGEEEKLWIARNVIVPAIRDRIGITEAQVTFAKGSEDAVIRLLIREFTDEPDTTQLENVMVTFFEAGLAEYHASQGLETTVLTTAHPDRYRRDLPELPRRLDRASDKPLLGEIIVPFVRVKSGKGVLHRISIHVEPSQNTAPGAVRITGDPESSPLMRTAVERAYELALERAAHWFDIHNPDNPDYEENIRKYKAIRENSYLVNMHDLDFPKDGDSFGVPLFIGFESIFRHRSIQPDFVATGVIDDFGGVRPIEGLRQKVLTSFAAGFRTFSLPKRNRWNLESELANSPLFPQGYIWEKTFDGHQLSVFLPHRWARAGTPAEDAAEAARWQTRRAELLDKAALEGLLIEEVDLGAYFKGDPDKVKAFVEEEKPLALPMTYCLVEHGEDVEEDDKVFHQTQVPPALGPAGIAAGAANLLAAGAAFAGMGWLSGVFAAAGGIMLLGRVWYAHLAAKWDLMTAAAQRQAERVLSDVEPLGQAFPGGVQVREPESPLPGFWEILRSPVALLPPLGEVSMDDQGRRVLRLHPGAAWALSRANRWDILSRATALNVLLHELAPHGEDEVSGKLAEFGRVSPRSVLLDPVPALLRPVLTGLRYVIAAANLPQIAWHAWDRSRGIHRTKAAGMSDSRPWGLLFRALPPQKTADVTGKGVFTFREGKLNDPGFVQELIRHAGLNPEGPLACVFNERSLDGEMMRREIAKTLPRDLASRVVAVSQNDALEGAGISIERVVKSLGRGLGDVRLHILEDAAGADLWIGEALKILLAPADQAVDLSGRTAEEMIHNIYGSSPEGLRLAEELRRNGKIRIPAHHLPRLESLDTHRIYATQA